MAIGLIRVCQWRSELGAPDPNPGPQEASIILLTLQHDTRVSALAYLIKIYLRILSRHFRRGCLAMAEAPRRPKDLCRRSQPPRPKIGMISTIQPSTVRAQQWSACGLGRTLCCLEARTDPLCCPPHRGSSLRLLVPLAKCTGRRVR